MQRGAALKYLSFLGKPDILQYVPYPDDFYIFMPQKLLFAAWAGGNDRGISKLCKLVFDKLKLLPVHLIAPRPIAYRAAAAEHQRNAALKARA